MVRCIDDGPEKVATIRLEAEDERFLAPHWRMFSNSFIGAVLRVGMKMQNPQWDPDAQVYFVRYSGMPDKLNTIMAVLRSYLSECRVVVAAETPAGRYVTMRWDNADGLYADLVPEEYARQCELEKVEHYRNLYGPYAS